MLSLGLADAIVVLFSICIQTQIQVRRLMTTAIPLHTDAPIDGGANSPDLLHRADFSNRIADVINGMPLNSGFVFSIEGAGGTGKTSVLNLI
ncbi:MAG: hypothetical protein HYZ46_04320, partial [Nitrosomonadales bacterium]|nr:hypothetical protein [Nitrosomonadales bacterium]